MTYPEAGVKSDVILNEARKGVKAITLFQSIKDKTICELVKEEKEENHERPMAAIEKEVQVKVGKELYGFLQDKTISDIVESDDASILKAIERNNEELKSIIREAVEGALPWLVFQGVKLIKLG